MKRHFALLLVVLSAFSGANPLLAQNAASSQPVLPVATAQTKLDGVASPGEYTYSDSGNNMELSLRRLDANRLAFHLRVRTKGWIALGFGSQRMNGAHILIGYHNGNPVFEEHTGQFHLHRKANETVLEDGLLAENGDFTVWEGIIDSRRFTGSAKLELILAYGTRDNLTTKHQAYRSLSLSLP